MVDSAPVTVTVSTTSTAGNKLLTGFKTFIVACLLIILPPLVQFAMGYDWRTMIPDSLTWAAPMIIGVIMAALRWFTKTPIFQQATSINPGDSRLGGLQ